MAHMPETVTLHDAFRTGRAYTVRQAATWAGTSPATVKRWLQGYEQPGHSMTPVFGPRQEVGEGGSLMMSFMQLVEVVVVARFRQSSRPVKLETFREARRKAQERWGIEYPFASVKMVPLGGHIVSEYGLAPGLVGMVAVDAPAQPTLPLPELVKYEFDHRIAFDGDQWAVRWYPLGKEKPLVVDPHIAGGRPTIVNRGVTVETLTLRWKNGEPIRVIARDYDLEEDQVEEVFRLIAA